MMALQNLQAPVLQSPQGDACLGVVLYGVKEGFLHPFTGN
jgi:hypothetical protein